MVGLFVIVLFCLAKLELYLENKVVASCGTRRIKRTPSWRSQNERPVKTGARVVLLGHTRHCFVLMLLTKSLNKKPAPTLRAEC